MFIFIWFFKTENVILRAHLQQKNWLMQTGILHNQYPYPKMGRPLPKSGVLQRYWFQAFMLGLVIYVLFSKDISIQVGLSTGGILPDGAEVMPARKGEAQNAVSMPTALKDAPPMNVSALLSQKVKKGEVPVANTMANLTPILSPGYAKRKGIAQAVVDQKLRVCQAYIRRFAPVAIQEMQEFGIPASITLAQGLLESNAGESRLAMESNNHFGIKCRTKCRGCTCRNYSDDDIYDMFRVFDSAWESYREHSELLNGGRYSHLKKHGNNYKNWAYGLKKAGYATDPRYAEKLIQIIKFLNLDQYDQVNA